MRRTTLFALALLAATPAYAASPAPGDTLVASQVGYVPGVVVCPSGDLLRLSDELLEAKYRLQVLGPELRRLWEAEHGTYATNLRLRDLGCTLVPPGGRLTFVERVGALVHVTTGAGYDGYATTMGLSVTR